MSSEFKTSPPHPAMAPSRPTLYARQYQELTESTRRPKGAHPRRVFPTDSPTIASTKERRQKTGRCRLTKWSGYDSRRGNSSGFACRFTQTAPGPQNLGSIYGENLGNSPCPATRWRIEFENDQPRFLSNNVIMRNDIKHCNSVSSSRSMNFSNVNFPSRKAGSFLSRMTS